jgi:acetylornithine deacetylase/succinyl-diaminopimelate desuccinylase-like protein
VPPGDERGPDPALVQRALAAGRRAAEHAAARPEALLAELTALRRVPSVAADPPAGAMAQAAALVAEAMRARGFTAQGVSDGEHPSIPAELPRGGPGG